MQFNFATAGRLIFDSGASAQCGDHARSLGIRRLLLVTDKGIMAAGIAAPIIAALTDAGLAVAVFDNVSADPPVSVIETARDAAITHKADGDRRNL
ncbi:MAG: iron-containing alcohol dehydrogenase [Pseudomonadota bacterium]